ncbi:hypothetical protein [Vreelandella nanhaiensis]|uniref:Uncharacterized protein n=1 Tax=Vreelandella nanhaiensis TaxID=1258546 RepID=A0A433KY81_9GAMM|nr:hypothetical protein [Halomonas nanhaiensis]RUR34494.1 hypothetical protein ELY38_02575 [Halomonas nanhaiensis]
MTDTTQKGGQHSRRAAMLCQNPRFGLYLDQRRRRVHQVPVDQMPDGTHTPEDCADWLRKACSVESRAEIDHNDAARVMLDRIMADYSKWERKQRQRGDV